MNTHPEKWYIPLTPENYDEVKAWWLKQVEKSGWTGRNLHGTFIVLSVHPNDDSCCWAGSEEHFIEQYPSYKKITLEQFRAITNPLPEHWYIKATEENIDELNRWRLSKRTINARQWDSRFVPGASLLSKHPDEDDGSYFWLKHSNWAIKHPEYKPITIEQFRQITNSLPEHWCIEATEENFAELYPWWRANASESFKVFAIGFTLMSSNPDGSCYFSNCEEQCVKSYPNYQPITLEQFRQITNSKPMNTLPTKWLIEVTEENQKELDRWRQQVATEYRERTLYIGYTLLSKHCGDNSCYFNGDAKAVRSIEEYADYQEITLEQFRQITNSKPMTKSIQISRYLLNRYYEAASVSQKAYLTKHFKLDGTTTDEAIRGLYELACGDWKPKIKANHPDCFLEDSKYFDFSEHTNKYGYHNIVSSDVAHSLGLCRNFIEVRNSDTKNSDRSFYLTNDYNWELVKDAGAMVLIPTKKVK